VIVAVDLDTTGERAALIFKASYVVGLPAVHAEVEILHLFEHLVGVDTYCCITFTGYLISLADEFFFHG